MRYRLTNTREDECLLLLVSPPIVRFQTSAHSKKARQERGGEGFFFFLFHLGRKPSLILGMGAGVGRGQQQRMEYLEAARMDGRGNTPQEKKGGWRVGRGREKGGGAHALD